MYLSLEKILGFVFNDRLSSNDILRFNDIYYSNKRAEPQTDEELLDYILNIAGYYNLDVYGNMLSHFGLSAYLEKKHKAGQLLTFDDLDKKYQNIKTASDIINGGCRGGILIRWTNSVYKWFLLPEYKEFLEPAILRGKVDRLIYKMVGKHPQKIMPEKIMLKTSDDCMKYMLDCLMGLGRIVDLDARITKKYHYKEYTAEDEQLLAKFNDYLEKMRAKGLLLGEEEVAKRFGFARLAEQFGVDFNAYALCYYGEQRPTKILQALKNGSRYLLLPIENLDDFTSCVGIGKDKTGAGFFFNKDFVLKKLYGHTCLVTPENIKKFEKTHQAPANGNIVELIEYCVDFASYYGIILEAENLFPINLIEFLKCKQQRGELLDASDVKERTKIDKNVLVMLNNFRKANPTETLRYRVICGYNAPQMYLKAGALEKFVEGARQYQFVTLINKELDRLKKQKRKKR